MYAFFSANSPSCRWLELIPRSVDLLPIGAYRQAYTRLICKSLPPKPFYMAPLQGCSLLLDISDLLGKYIPIYRANLVSRHYIYILARGRVVTLLHLFWCPRFSFDLCSIRPFSCIRAVCFLSPVYSWSVQIVNRFIGLPSDISDGERCTV